MKVYAAPLYYVHNVSFLISLLHLSNSRTIYHILHKQADTIYIQCPENFTINHKNRRRVSSRSSKSVNIPGDLNNAQWLAINVLQKKVLFSPHFQKWWKLKSFLFLHTTLIIYIFLLLIQLWNNSTASRIFVPCFAFIYYKLN